LLGQDFGDALRVLAPQRLAGEDYRAGVDLVGMQARGLVGLIDDAAEPGKIGRASCRERVEIRVVAGAVKIMKRRTRTSGVGINTDSVVYVFFFFKQKTAYEIS